MPDYVAERAPAGVTPGGSFQTAAMVSCPSYSSSIIDSPKLRAPAVAKTTTFVEYPKSPTVSPGPRPTVNKGNDWPGLLSAVLRFYYWWEVCFLDCCNLRLRSESKGRPNGRDPRRSSDLLFVDRMMIKVIHVRPRVLNTGAVVNETYI